MHHNQRYTINQHYSIYARSFDQAVKLYQARHPGQPVNSVSVELNNDHELARLALQPHSGQALE